MDGDSLVVDTLRADIPRQTLDSINTALQNTEDDSQMMPQLKKAASNKDQYINELLTALSYALFLLMPVFALILLLLYIRRRHYYVEHLIFSINMHSFALLIMTLILSVMLIRKGNDSNMLWFLLIIPAYFLAGMKYFYRQSMIKVILKSILLALIYLVVLSGTLAALAILTLYWF